MAILGSIDAGKSCIMNPVSTIVFSSDIHNKILIQPRDVYNNILLPHQLTPEVIKQFKFTVQNVSNICSEKSELQCFYSDVQNLSFKNVIRVKILHCEKN